MLILLFLLVTSSIDDNTIRPNCEFGVIYDMVTIGDEIWAIDFLSSTLLNIKEDGTCTVFSQLGQGPGDLERPEVIYFENDLIHVMNLNGKLSRFDLNGEYVSGMIPTQNVFPVNQMVVKNQFIITSGVAWPYDRFAINNFDKNGQHKWGYFEAEEDILDRHIHSYSKQNIGLFNDMLISIWSLNFEIIAIDINGKQKEQISIEIPTHYVEPGSYRDRANLIDNVSDFWIVDKILTSNLYFGVVTTRAVDYENRFYEYKISLYDQMYNYTGTYSLEDGAPIHITNNRIYYRVEAMDGGHIAIMNITRDQ